MNNANLIRENSTMKYRVILDGKVLTEVASTSLADNFILSLLPEQQSRVQVVPITSEGQQILFG